MEPETKDNSGVDTTLEAPSYHTVSGGPETLREVELKNKEKEISVDSVITQSLTEQKKVDIDPSLDTVTNKQAVKEQKSFFDRHTTGIVFFVNLLFGPLISGFVIFFISSFLMGFSPKLNSSIIPAITTSLPAIVFIATIILGAFNFRGKRQEIFRGIGYLIIFGLVVVLVGLGICFLLIGRN